MEYRIGSIGENLPQNYIVADECGDLVFYAAEMFNRLSVGHSDIAGKYNLGRVLGGGEAIQEEGNIMFGSFSLEYGTVPRQVLEKFDLAGAYANFHPDAIEVRDVPFDEKIWHRYIKQK